MAYQLSGNDEHFDGAADKYNRCCFLRSRWRGGIGSICIAGIYYLAVYMLGFGFSIGLQVMIARRNGECGYGKAGKIFFQGFFFLSGLAILLLSADAGKFSFHIGKVDFLTGDLSGCNSVSGLAQFRFAVFVSVFGYPFFFLWE